MTPTLATCPVCGRQVVVHDGRLREHLEPLDPDSWAGRKCRGSGTKADGVATCVECGGITTFVNPKGTTRYYLCRKHGGVPSGSLTTERFDG